MGETQQQLPSFLDKNPDLKERLAKYLRKVSPDQRRQNLETVRKFASGEITWAEIRGLPKRMLHELARIGYTLFKSGDFRRAESIFKGLAVIDHNNWYYRMALGSIFQKQKLYEQAITEYDFALMLGAEPLMILANRGQCHMKIGDNDAALEDFSRILKMPLPDSHPWIKRARMLSQMILSGAGR